MKRRSPQRSPMRQPALPGGAGADPAGHQRLGGRVAGDGGDDEVAVGTDQVDARPARSPGRLDHAVGDGLQGVREAAGGVEVRRRPGAAAAGSQDGHTAPTRSPCSPSPRDLAVNQGFSSASLISGALRLPPPLNHSELPTGTQGQQLMPLVTQVTAKPEQVSRVSAVSRAPTEHRLCRMRQKYRWTSQGIGRESTADGQSRAHRTPGNPSGRTADTRPESQDRPPIRGPMRRRRGRRLAFPVVPKTPPPLPPPIPSRRPLAC